MHKKSLCTILTLIIGLPVLPVQTISFEYPENIRTVAFQQAEDTLKGSKEALERLQNLTKQGRKSERIFSTLSKNKGDEEKANFHLLQAYKLYIQCEKEIPQEVEGVNRESYRSFLKENCMRLYNAGIYYNEQKQFTLADDCYATLTDLLQFGKDNYDVTLEDVVYNRAHIAYWAKDYQKVVTLLSPLDPMPHARNGYKYLSESYKALKQFPEMAKALRKGAEQFPGDEFFFNNLGLYYLEHRQYDEGLKFLNHYHSVDRSSEKILRLQLELATRKHDTQLEIATAKELLNVTSQKLDIAVHIGEAYIELAMKTNQDSPFLLPDLNNPEYVKEQALIKSYYQEASHYLEFAKKLAPHRNDLWERGLKWARKYGE